MILVFIIKYSDIILNEKSIESKKDCHIQEKQNQEPY
jgi:hypothetical protein